MDSTYLAERVANCLRWGNIALLEKTLQKAARRDGQMVADALEAFRRGDG